MRHPLIFCPSSSRFVLEEIGCVQWHMLEAPAGIAKRANPSCALKQTFRLLREHTRLAERWAGKACRRGSLRWLLLRASVSCDAQQLIAISHRAPDWTSASLLRPSRLPLAGLVTTASSGASWAQHSEHAAARAAGNAVSTFLEHASRTKRDNAQIAKTPYSLPSKKTASPHLPA